ERMVLRDETELGEHLRGFLDRRGAEHLDPACARAAQADGELEQRRLAGPVRADERGHGSGRDLERAVTACPDRAVAPSEAGGLHPGPAAHAIRLTWLAPRTVSAKSAEMPSSSSPAARARETQRPSPARRSRRSGGGSLGGWLEMNVPSPR